MFFGSILTKIFLLNYLCSFALSSGSRQKILTAIDCEASVYGWSEWHRTKYGPNGGSDGYTGFEGRIFEQECQNGYCFDTEGEQGDSLFTCGFAWKESKDLKPDDMVLVDVKSIAHNHWNPTCPPSYDTVAHWDSEGNWAVGSNGESGHWSFLLCTRTIPFEEVMDVGSKVVTDMKAIGVDKFACKDDNTWQPGWRDSEGPDGDCHQWWNNYSWGASENCHMCESWGYKECQKLCCEVCATGREADYGSYLFVGSWDTTDGNRNRIYNGQGYINVKWSNQVYLFQNKEYPQIDTGRRLLQINRPGSD